MSRTELRHEWEDRLAPFESNVQTATAWCAAQGINVPSFPLLVQQTSGPRSRQASNGEVGWLSVETESFTKLSSSEALTVQVGQARIEASEAFRARSFVQC